LGEDEEDDEEHHLVTPPFGVAPESRVKLCYAGARKRIAHDQSTLLRSVGSSAISTRVRPGVVYCRTRALGFWKESSPGDESASSAADQGVDVAVGVLEPRGLHPPRMVDVALSGSSPASRIARTPLPSPSAPARLSPGRIRHPT